MPDLTTTLPDWAVTPEKVRDVVERLVAAARPLKLFLFGSYARGEAGPGSDLDVLVVADDSVANPRGESVRLRQHLRGIPLTVDILVVTESFFNAQRDNPGLIYQEIVETGRLVYERPR